MIPVLTPAEMAAIDAAAPEPVEVLIERAGAAVARVALEMLGGGYGRRVVVVAGPGNNGADGRAAASRLRRRGARVEEVDAVSAPDRLPPNDLVIDAAFGAGLRREYVAPDPEGSPVLAVDLPSGVSGLTGQVEGRAMQATRTVTFAALKPGLLLEPGRSLAGAVSLADIGLDVGEALINLIESSDVSRWIPARPADSHKWDAAVLVIAGSPGMTGSAQLAAAAAQRAGAGMVRLATPGASSDAARPVESVGVCLEPGPWAAAAGRCRSLVIGPGLGRGDAIGAQVRALLADADLPTVVDADALVALAGHLGDGSRRRAADTVLTPHDGEFEHLTGARPAADRIAAARDLAATSGSVVLLKGPTTIVANAGGDVRVVTTGDARLATAGTGDVLSGVVGALLARGVPAFDAAAAGAWIHGRACAHGPSTGLVASDLLDALPAALDEVLR
ncbi:MAG: NAD(P)H-hydrate dehydratase [Microthrixaceae bacterium]